MAYIYTEANRLDQPHKYMYIKFEGSHLIKSYQTDRMDVLKRVSMISDHEKVAHVAFDYFLEIFFTMAFDQHSAAAGAKYRELLPHPNQRNVPSHSETDNSKIINFANSLPKYTDAEPIVTLELLQSIIASQLISLHDVKVKEWLDRVLQRFEVTKKIYEGYPEGFRKGEGSDALVLLYWLLALSLSLYYVKNNSVKYLSTLLKVCDLLCSLPDPVMFGQLSKQTMATILSTELVSVEMLVKDKVGKNAV